MAYLLSAVLMRDFGSADAAATLLRFPAIAIAAVAVTGAYVWLWFSVAPKPIETLSPRQNDWDRVVLEASVAETQARASIAAQSRWWHHLLGAAAGGIFGTTLAWVLVWLLA